MIAKPLRWRADKLAARLGLTDAERRRLRITTIGAVDKARDARQAERTARKREAEKLRRQAQGVRNRAEYQAGSANRTKPWLACGISRATWYRQRRSDEGLNLKTSANASNKITICDICTTAW